MRIEYITSYKFARISDFVFSEVVTKQQFNDLKPDNIDILYENNSHICYQKKEIKISDHSIIFCINSSLEVLFHYVKKENIKDLVLITNQTDDKISKSIFKKLPKQFSNWYSINVDCIDERLHPIPLGMSNGYEKSLSFKNENLLIDLNQFTIKKENLLYLSFEDNTNIRERNGLKDYFKKYDWVKIINGKNELTEYGDDLKNSNFVLCPQGNGIDTHRIWEALYVGAIPIVKNQTGLKKFSELPIMYVDSFSDITKDSLISFLENLIVKDLEQIKFQYWREKILSKKTISPNFVNIKIDNNYLKYLNKKENIKKIFFKGINGYFRLIYKIKTKLKILFKK